MKLLLENWGVFLKEQEINEATEQEIEYLNDALEIPIEDLPFGNIFGNSYRIIEPFTSMSEDTSFGVTMKALKKFKWDVASPKDGKILCTKTKVTHFINGKGELGVSRKSVTLNLPKVLAGIVNFAKGSRAKLLKEAAAEMFTATKRYADAAKEGKLDELPADVKYILPSDITDPNIKHTANEFRKIMKFYDNQVYWLGSKRSAGKLKFFFNAIGVNFESFENYSTYVNDSMEDLMNNIDKYLVKNYVIYSRHPIDVFRMSDHEGIQSCHSLPSEKHSDNFDEYNRCALSEAYGNGMIAYVIPAKDFKMFPPTQESLDKVDGEEIFYDKKRPDAGELVPISRIRIKNVAFHKDENSEPIRLAVPQGKIYGPQYPGFIDAVTNKVSGIQEKEIKEIIKQGAEDLGRPTIFLSKFTRYGGSYQDSGYSVAQSLPMLFRKYSRDLVLQGSAVRYEPDIEEALMVSIGQSGLEGLKQRLNEIFDGETGGFISFSWEAEEDYDGNPSFTWEMFVTFKMNIPGSADVSEIRNAVVDAADSYFPDYYQIPETDNVFVSRYDENTWQIQLAYNYNNLGDETGYLEGLEESLPEIVRKMNVFDHYYDDGAIQLIEYTMEEYGVLPAERYNLRDVLADFGLPDDAWWNVAEEDYKETDYFGGEYIDHISFEDSSSIDISGIKDKIPENMKEAGYKHIADFLSLVATNNEVASKLVLNQEVFDPEKDPNIFMTYSGSAHGLKPEEIEQADEIEITVGVSMYNDYSEKRLQKTAWYLKGHASIDDLVERVEVALEKYVADKLKEQQSITENKKRVRIHVKR
tara:strand:+ start:182 stop:2608 length:2427 start_codon:yes stop_codon:yes gene_type:complete